MGRQLIHPILVDTAGSQTHLFLSLLPKTKELLPCNCKFNIFARRSRQLAWRASSLILFQRPFTTRSLPSCLSYPFLLHLQSRSFCFVLSSSPPPSPHLQTACKTAATMPDQKRKRVHNQRNLCDYILSLVDKSSVPLRIGASPIPNAGSGLFVVADVAAGADIFRSQPLLLVSEGNNLDVCDYCFLNKNSLISPENKFFVGPERDKIEMSACMGCKIARYCSKV